MTMPNISLLSVPLMLLTVLLSGCQSTQRTATAGAPLPMQTEQQASKEVQHLRQCQQELKALNTLQAASYPALQRTFEQLMRGAAQYAGLRTNVNENTQDTVDSLYRYRVNLLCAQINQAVLNRLAEQGGTAQ
uniref:Lipoprotein n=2 Tax=Serratia TaxID=613 RepID=A8GJF5_SERP5